jgi:hypothetical protein
MEARWKGAEYDAALDAALGDQEELDEYSASTVSGLLIGYYRYYGERETVGKLMPEEQFDYQLARSRTFRVSGKLDGLGSLTDGRSVIVEGKTTGDSIAPDSEYWQRLRFNPQLLQYVLAARQHGWNISEVIYDVTRKPSIQPKQVYDTDESGCKIVIDKDDHRVFKKDGSPRETGDTEKGWTVKSHIESPDEFADRLIADIASRPEFYFARREAPILEDDLREFESQRLMLARMILHCRHEETTLSKPESAWPRQVSDQTCSFCAFKSFCLQNISIDPQSLPEGFSIQFNPELEAVQP